MPWPPHAPRSRSVVPSAAARARPHVTRGQSSATPAGWARGAVGPHGDDSARYRRRCHLQTPVMDAACPPLPPCREFISSSTHAVRPRAGQATVSSPRFVRTGCIAPRAPRTTCACIRHDRDERHVWLFVIFFFWRLQLAGDLPLPAGGRGRSLSLAAGTYVQGACMHLGGLATRVSAPSRANVRSSTPARRAGNFEEARGMIISFSFSERKTKGTRITPCDLARSRSLLVLG